MKIFFRCLKLFWDMGYGNALTFFVFRCNRTSTKSDPNILVIGKYEHDIIFTIIHRIVKHSVLGRAHGHQETQKEIFSILL